MHQCIRSRYSIRCVPLQHATHQISTKFQFWIHVKNFCEIFIQRNTLRWANPRIFHFQCEVVMEEFLEIGGLSFQTLWHAIYKPLHLAQMIYGIVRIENHPTGQKFKYYTTNGPDIDFKSPRNAQDNLRSPVVPRLHQMCMVSVPIERRAEINQTNPCVFRDFYLGPPELPFHGPIMNKYNILRLEISEDDVPLV